MGNRHRVARKILIPVAHTRRHQFVALATGRDEVPLILLARGDALRVARMQLRDGEAFPIAERYLGKLVVNTIAVGRQAERRPQQLHRLAGTPKRARHIIKFGRVTAIAHKQVAQNIAAVNGLRPPARIQRHVATALQAASDIPVGFSVTDVIDGWPLSDHYSSLPTAMSGASGCLMPTIW